MLTSDWQQTSAQSVGYILWVYPRCEPTLPLLEKKRRGKILSLHNKMVVDLSSQIPCNSQTKKVSRMLFAGALKACVEAPGGDSLGLGFQIAKAASSWVFDGLIESHVGHFVAWFSPPLWHYSAPNLALSSYTIPRNSGVFIICPIALSRGHVVVIAQWYRPFWRKGSLTQPAPSMILY